MELLAFDLGLLLQEAEVFVHLGSVARADLALERALLLHRNGQEVVEVISGFEQEQHLQRWRVVSRSQGESNVGPHQPQATAAAPMRH